MREVPSWQAGFRSAGKMESREEAVNGDRFAGLARQDRE
jgi:hypothetical protein